MALGTKSVTKRNARKGYRTGTGGAYQEKERTPQRTQDALRVATLRELLAVGVRVKGFYFGVPYRGKVYHVGRTGVGVDFDKTTLGKTCCWIPFEETGVGGPFGTYYKQNLTSLKILGK